MAQNETWLKHDLLDAVKVQYLNGNLFSMDNAGNLIGVTLTRDGEDYSGGGSVSANVIRSDGGTVAVTGALSGKTATVVLPQSAYAVPGVVSVVVKLTVSGEVTTIAALVANVYRSSTDTVIDPGTIIPSVQALIAAIDTAVASIPADYSSLWASLAPAFSTSSAYTAGRYVTYNGGLYRFTVDHAAGAWSSSQVASVNVGGELSDLKNALNFSEGAEILYLIHGYCIATNGSTGSTVDLTPIQSATYNTGGYAITNCQENDVFTVNGNGGNGSRLWCFVDSENKLISKSASQAVGTNLILIAPENAAKVIFNSTTDKGIVKGRTILNKIDDLNKADENAMTNDEDITVAFDAASDIEIVKLTHGYCITTNGSVGDTVDLTPVESSYYDDGGYAIVNCSKDTKFTVNGTGGSGGRLWCFVDSSNKILSRSASGAVGDNLILTAPENTAKVIFNSTTNDGIAKGVTPAVRITNLEGNSVAGLTFVDDEAGLLNALENKDVIYLMDDIDVTADIVINRDVIIDGLGHTLKAATTNSIVTTVIEIDSGCVTIKDMILIGDQTKRDVIWIKNNGANVLIDHCTVHTASGSIIRTSGTTEQSKIVIRNCDIGFSYGNDGVAPDGNSDVRVFDSVLHDCYDEGFSSHNYTYAECHNCEFYNNGYTVGTKNRGSSSTFGGCHIGGGKMGIVEGCYSHDNFSYGIALINFQQDLESDTEKCYNNLVQNNGMDGIVCTYCKNLTLVNNVSIHNTGNAIFFGVASEHHDTPIGIKSSGYVAGNIMYENGTDSVVIDSAATSDDLHVQPGQIAT